MRPDRSMPPRHLDDLHAFATVARLRSFTRAAAELGISPSMLSYTIRRLEERLAMVLLRRTSRSVAPTAEGEVLLRTLAPALAAIDDTLATLASDRDRVAGTVRLTATRQAHEVVLRPVLAEFGARHPRATLEVVVDFGLRDIVADGFDAGIRLHEKLEQDMVAIPVGPPTLAMSVVASPAYLARHAAPARPEDLSAHRCIGHRLVSANLLVDWAFRRAGESVTIAASGPLVFNEPALMLAAAVDGLGVAWVLEQDAAPHVEAGRLVRLLADWTLPFAGYCLYYPSRRQATPVLAALLALLRERQPSVPAVATGPSEGIP